MVAPLTPGRRAVLTFGVPLVLWCVGWGALSLVNIVGLASYTETATLTAHVAVLTVSAPAGDITLVASPDALVHVSATGHYTLHEPAMHTASTAAGVTVKGERCPPIGEIVCGQDITVALPPGFTVTAGSGGGDIRAIELAGPLTLHSSAGDVRVEAATGPLTLSSTGGDVTGKSLQATDVSASSTAGDVSLGFIVVPDQVTASSTAGDVTVRVPGSAAYKVKSARAGAGDSHVGVRRDDSSGHVLRATSSAGDVTIEPNGS